ncbi:MAG TPA: mechanosensitive ion channel domain-containing protein [Verrucomicrobiae bacterium]|nr:mechanosensitive ion channel domain-containing protein [Verrucomicrobiae bacterium]
MKISRTQVITLLAFCLLLLIAVGVFGTWFAPLLGETGASLERYLVQPLFTLGGLSVTPFFLVKVAIFLMLLILGSHFTMIVLQRRVLTYTPLAVGQQYVVARVISYLVFILGLMVGLESAGLNLNSLVVVGGALGIGVGFGLQAVVGNFVAGLILLMEQPVRVGDRIEVGNTYGDVVAMRGRSTWIRTNDNVVIIVPNSEFINQRVTNWTANDRRVRIALTVGVSYESDPQNVRGVILSVARNHPDVLPEPGPEVVFLDFGESSLDFELRIWTVHQLQTPGRLKSDLYFALFEAFHEKGIGLPFPQCDLHLKSVPETIASAIHSPGLTQQEHRMP